MWISCNHSLWTFSRKIECGERARKITPHIHLRVLHYSEKDGFIQAKGKETECWAELKDLGSRPSHCQAKVWAHEQPASPSPLPPNRVASVLPAGRDTCRARLANLRPQVAWHYSCPWHPTGLMLWGDAVCFSETRCSGGNTGGEPECPGDCGFSEPWSRHGREGCGRDRPGASRSFSIFLEGAGGIWTQSLGSCCAAHGRINTALKESIRDN